MVNFDRQTIMLVGLIISLVTCFYLFKETQKQKIEFNSLVSKLSQVPTAPARDSVKKKKVTVIAPEDTNEVIDSAEESDK